MSAGVAAERRFLSRDELTSVEASHYPQLADLDSVKLREMQGQLRGLRDKASTVAGHKKREVRGKAPARASGASGSYDHAARRKQIFSQALRRTNRQLERIEHAEARARTRAGVERALALKRRDELLGRPDPGRFARGGMRDNPSLRRAMLVDPNTVGRVSQRGKAAQAKRDAAG